MQNNHLTIGFLAHVDAGKTTLSEAILYTTGAIRKLGRVDHKTAFLDTNSIEQNRGITVFSKEARFEADGKKFTLLDTPGHVDFGNEAERTLQVLDYAVLIISGADGVQGHTITLWKLLAAYNVPVFVFVNKMDQAGTDKNKILNELNSRFGSGFAEFYEGMPANIEETASCDETLIEEYFDQKNISSENIAGAVKKRNLFPVCFGSALKMEGIWNLIEVMCKYTRVPDYPDEFGARVYKISRDKQGVRQTHMKITGGRLQSKMPILQGKKEEKVEQIRFYSGKGFESSQIAEAGMICAVTGLSATYAGQQLGIADHMVNIKPKLEPALTYRVILPEGTDCTAALQKLRQIEEEEPSLQIVWKETLQEIHVKATGRLELEVLQHIVKERFDMDVEFGDGSIIYKETISKPVIGIGHFEPLRHYAEVQLLMEPLDMGQGKIFDSIVSEDKLDRNWQRLILSHLAEREHLGILTGSFIDDVKITLIGGRAHIKHTEGGDFRQATYRAVRQGLCKGESVLLEPMYEFRAEVPSENVGRVLSDMQRFGASCKPPEALEDGNSLIEGRGAVSVLKDYQQDLISYTKGKGKFTVIPCGYDKCHNQQEVVDRIGYRFEEDLDNPAGSVFCSSGSAVYVKWDQVDDMAHVDSGYKLTEDGVFSDWADVNNAGCSASSSYDSASAKELDEIFFRTYGKSKRDEAIRREQLSKGSRKPLKPKTWEKGFSDINKSYQGKNLPYYVVDGYNLIFAWEELSQLAKANLDAARETLIEILENYMAYKKIAIVVVFDGYKVKGGAGSKINYGDMKVVYTKEAQTADRFIEETVYEMGRSFDVTVITSDRPVQMAALGDGASRMSARDFYQEVISTSEEIREKLKKQRKASNRPFEGKL